MTYIGTMMFVAFVLVVWLAVGAVYITVRMKDFKKNPRPMAWYEIATCFPWWLAAQLAKPVDSHQG